MTNPWMCALLVTCLAVSAACGSDDGADRAATAALERSDAAPKTTASTTLPSDPSEAVDGGGDAPVEAPPERADESAGAGQPGPSTTVDTNTSPSVAPSEDPSRIARPLAEGSVEYAVSGTITERSSGIRDELPPVGTWSVTDTGNGRQRVVLDVRDDRRGGVTLAQELSYDDAGALLHGVHTIAEVRGQRDERQLTAEVPQRIAAVVMASGDRFEVAMSGSDVTAAAVAEVIGWETAGDRRTLHVKLAIDLQGEMSGTIVLAVWLDPTTGLPVRAEGQARIRYRLYDVDLEFTAVR
jgi:hypothetical protein